ncbi:MAG: hypothetical protein E2598_07495 [Sphingobium sp.]|nr:hypothetical protein [Sphingobium sp.]
MPRWALFVVDQWLRCQMQAPMMMLGVRAAAPYPCPGGWQDQPAALMDAFAILNRLTQGEDKE